jgi:Tol biopolymer transport system component
MTRERTADERISGWLRDEAPDQLPDRVLRATFERTRQTRQRRTLLGWRTPQMRRITTAIAVGAAAMVLLVVGVGILQRGDLGVGDGQSPAVSGQPTVEPTLDPSATPGPISLTGQIAFDRMVDGNTDLYLMNLDRTGLVRLTTDPGDDHQASWTPDGRTLLFARRSETDFAESDIYALDIETGNETQLTDYPGVEGEPNVSPDGTRVAFAAETVEPGLYVMDIDGSNRRLLWTPPDDTYVLIGWAADGQSLYQIRNGNSISQIDVATGAVSSGVAGGDENMQLSPDGTTFAFWGDGRPPGGVFLMNVDGTNVRHVQGSGFDGGKPVWAPDGQHLAYALPDGWVYIVGADGSGLTRWIDDIGGYAWRPD